MKKLYRANLIGGVTLILLGAWFLAVQLIPALGAWASLNWPLAVIAVGVFLLLIGLLGGTPGMAVPACIVGGIGGLLFWQNATNNWESWAYAWTLIPGFVGVGIILENLLSRRGLRSLRGGARLIFISLALFAIFGSFLGASPQLIRFWPLLLIVAGLWLLMRSLVRVREPE
jgi:hypothetical protein